MKVECSRPRDLALPCSAPCVRASSTHRGSYPTFRYPDDRALRRSAPLARGGRAPPTAPTVPGHHRAAPRGRRGRLRPRGARGPALWCRGGAFPTCRSFLRGVRPRDRRRPPRRRQGQARTGRARRPQRTGPLRPRRRDASGSVLIAAYNEATPDERRGLVATVRGVAAQAGVTLEILVGDDGSDDGTYGQVVRGARSRSGPRTKKKGAVRAIGELIGSDGAGCPCASSGSRTRARAPRSTLSPRMRRTRCSSRWMRHDPCDRRAGEPRGGVRRPGRAVGGGRRLGAQRPVHPHPPPVRRVREEQHHPHRLVGARSARAGPGRLRRGARRCAPRSGGVPDRFAHRGLRAHLPPRLRAATESAVCPSS